MVQYNKIGFYGTATNLTFTVTSSNPATPLSLADNIGGAFNYPIIIFIKSVPG